MKLRKSTSTDLPTIMKIVSDAQHHLASLGINQWQDGYPNKKQILLDIENGISYVVTNEHNQVMATTAFTTEPESTYNDIVGKWVTNEKIYGVIHRMAVHDDFRDKGLAKFIFSVCHNMLKEMGVKSLRIDTHKDNKGMLYLLAKEGYKHCGVVYLESGGERLALEKLV